MIRLALMSLTIAAALGGVSIANDVEPRPNRPTIRAAVDSLPSPAGPGSAEPNLALDSQGRVYMSWLEAADSGHALKFAVLDGSKWHATRTIRAGRDFFANWADFPSIEVLEGGVLAAHWLQRTGKAPYAYGVRVALSRDGGLTWGNPLTPHRDTAQAEHGFVAMWREARGLGLVWLDGRKFSHEGHNANNEMMLMSTTLSAAGVLGAETPLDQRTCDCCQNSAALTAAGPIVAYRDRSPGEIRDIYVTRRVEGKWLEGVAVHDDGWKIAACPVNGPAIAASGNRVVVAWFTGADDKPMVKLAFSEDGGQKFGRPTRIDDGNPAGRVDVAMLPNGDALVSWIERDSPEVASVQVRRVKRNGRAGDPLTIASSSAARASGFPRMAVRRSDVVFAWTVPGRPSSIRVGRAALADIQ